MSRRTNALESLGRYLANHEIGDPGRHGREGGSFSSNGGVHDLYGAYDQEEASEY